MKNAELKNVELKGDADLDADGQGLDLDIIELDTRLEMVTPIGPEPDWWGKGGSGSGCPAPK